MIDSGAGAHVCSLDYANDYPIISNQHKVFNADGSSIKCYGERWVKYELIRGRLIWVRYLVCAVPNTAWSVSGFRRSGVNFNFGDELNIKFGSEFDVGF